MVLREKQSEHRKKQNEIREKFKEEVAKRDQMKKGDHMIKTLSPDNISGCYRN